MNLDQLWIGDILQSKSTGKQGKYAGQVDGKAKVQIGDDYILLDKMDVTIIEEESVLANYVYEQEEDLEVPEGLELPEKTLDLHIEVLNPNLVNAEPARILDYQIKAFKAFIENAYKNKKYSIIIIHGKGTGVLKKEIVSFIKYHPMVFNFHTYHEGALQLVLSQRMII